MGEYMLYRGDRIKVGTCENLYYLRFDQRHSVQECGDAAPNREPGLLAYRWRFPFPDEDHIEPGNFDDYDRGVEIPGYEPEEDYVAQLDAPPVGPYFVVQQKVVDVDGRCELQTVVRDSGPGLHGQLFRLSLYEAAKAAEAFVAEEGTEEGIFDIEMAKRIVAGYGKIIADEAVA